ncbi:MAG: ankyrin repeat domain-containing protein [Lentisphaeria bacterium]|nr:ankyrin repeat domain-containing protein [Lentisphaeria bacterium]NQZ68696.1 ankyrin repeat domain-containing protein [Lentisphaeria bacterium]
MKKLILTIGIMLSTALLAGDLHDAAGKGDIAGIKKALNAGADINKLKNDSTPLARAAMGRQLEAVKFLLSKKAKVNKSGKNKYTALHWSGHSPEIVAVLLKAGANVKLRNHVGQSALATAHNLDVMKLLIKAGIHYDDLDSRGSATPLSLRSNGTDAKLVEFLLKKGADPNGRGKSVPLIKAAMGGRIDNIRLLIIAGADVNRQNSRGNTALHRTANVAILRLLFENGAKRNIKNKQGETALAAATSNYKYYKKKERKKDKEIAGRYKAAMTILKNPPAAKPLKVKRRTSN